MRRILLSLLLLCLSVPLLPRAQEGLNLPTELYVLLNSGVVERYGLGTAGVRRVTPDAQFVTDFRVAPDGVWLAYRSPEGVYLRNLFTDEEPRQIEGERASVPYIRGRGETMAWSPDSSALAYTTEYGGRVHFFAESTFTDIQTPGLLNWRWSPDGSYLAAEADQGVWWIFRREGTAFPLAAALPGSFGGDWRTANQFVFAPLDGGLSVIDLSARNQQVPVQPGPQVYHLPTTLPDGRVRAFVGERTAARLVEISFSEAGIAAAQIGTGDVDLSGVRWSPGGTLLTAFQGGALALIDPISGAGFTLPITSASAYGWGALYPPEMRNVELPDEGTFIAPDANGIAQVWELPADGSLPASLTPAEYDVREYALAPDGRRIAYVSNSGLWLHEIDSGAAAQELLTLGLDADLGLSWDAAGETLYYRDEQDAGSGIWRVQPGAEPTLFLPDADEATVRNPRFARSLAALLVHRGETLMVVDSNTGAETSSGLRGAGRWLSGSQFLVLGDGSVGRGFYITDANSPADSARLLLPISPQWRVLDYRLLGEERLRVLVRLREPGTVQVFDVALEGGAAEVVADAGYLSEPHLAPGGEVVMGHVIPGGALVLHNLTDDSRVRIADFPQASAFRWRN